MQEPLDGRKRATKVALDDIEGIICDIYDTPSAFEDSVGFLANLACQLDALAERARDVCRHEAPEVPESAWHYEPTWRVE